MTGPSPDRMVAGDRQTTGRGRTGFELDLARCVGCGACVLACRMENQLPMGVSWRRVLQVNQPRIGGGPTYHLSVACHHCENPPCVGACPSGALKKGSDGLVLLDSDRCIGCRYCEMACPFGAPSFDVDARVMTKCHLCHHRLAEGSSPACVVACPTEALGYIPPHGGERVANSKDRMENAFAPAADIPGFGDPAGAGPGLWMADPGGRIRSRWFLELKALLGQETEGSHDPA
jgi:anaerobic dimethyl sulfoxide reductase subunit B (iron-sulfur subunit)